MTRKAVLLLAALLAALPIFPEAATPRPIETVVCSIGPGHPELEARLKVLRGLGVTSVQTYLYWNRIETRPGHFDWRETDRFLAVLKRAGLKWVPFVIAGPWYVTPRFAAGGAAAVMLRCLEHGRDNGAVSVWDEGFRPRVERYLAALARRYAASGMIESLNVGISGDYGEAIFPVTGNWPGEYHTHPGWWCGDRLAAGDFRAFCADRFAGDIGRLNAAWKAGFDSFAGIAPFHPDRSPSLRARLDLVAWYRGAMTRHAGWWLSAARRHFPRHDIYLCTGGDMAPEHGSDFSAQAKAAARHGCGLRVTNEASSFAHNFRLTGLAASACRFYGAYLGLEPAATVTAPGMVARVFNAVSSGARQFFFYYDDDLVPLAGEALSVGPAGDHLRRLRPLMSVARPRVNVALFYPTSSHAARGLGDFGRLAVHFRRAFDYDMVDEGMIADDALDRYPVLIVAGTAVLPRAVLERISAWVERGGTLFVMDSRPCDEDEDPAPFARLLGFAAGSEEVFGIAPMAAADPGGWPATAAALPMNGFRAWLGLDAGVEPILSYRAPEGGVMAWRRPLGRGAVYAYFAPLEWEASGESWMSGERLPLLFLKDAWARLASEGKLERVPASLNLDSPGLFAAETDAGLLVYNSGPVPAAWPAAGGEITVPADDIVRVDK